MYVCGYAHMRAREDDAVPEAGVAGGWELPGVVLGTERQSFRKGSGCS